MTLDIVLTSTTRLVMFSLILGYIELYRLKTLWTLGGPWANPHKNFDHIFIALLLLGFLTSVWFLVGGHPNILIAGLLLLSILISKKFNGSLNGGSDAMTHILLFGLFVGTIDQSFASLGLWYIGIQSMLSYFIGGVVKLKNTEWRSGAALSKFLQSSAYDVPTFFKHFSQNIALMFFTAWCVMLFEVSAAALLLLPDIAPIWITVAASFHLMNFFIFGLNRFFWTWLATYPCILWLVKNVPR